VRATVLVRPKPGILDPQGQAVEGSLRQLGFDVGETRVGRLIEFDIDAGSAPEALGQARRMCEQLLTNPLVETYEIEIQS
jgi:phosphoribosylformylglycinamidine synthase PurS subunit